MKRILRRVQREWVSRRLKRFLDELPVELTRLGTNHGGWVVPTKVATSGGTAVCVGAGEDVSFDVELNKRGFQVYTLDPTPRAKKHVQEMLEAAPSAKRMAINRSESEFYDLRGFDAGRFRFLDLGVWAEDTTMKFFAPKDQSHVSHSIVNLQKTEEYFEAKCVTLESLGKLLNLREFTLLKMDVEGAEYALLRSLIERGPRPEVVCVEFDEIRNPLDDEHPERIAEMVMMLKKSGYAFAHLEDSNALFLRRASGERFIEPQENPNLSSH